MHSQTTTKNVGTDSTSRARPDLKSGRIWPVPQRPWIMRMKWNELLFAHYPVAIADLKRWIPDRLKIDTFEGQAWIGIVPFHMSGVSPRWIPDVPWMSRFPELNVRTYVTIDNKPGVWFFSLDATNPIAVLGARYLFDLNYMKAKIEVAESEKWIDYRANRTHRGMPDASLHIEYRPIGTPFYTEPETLEHWFTSRYCMYTSNRSGQILRSEIDHPPWQLWNAQAIIHENTMFQGLQIEIPDCEPQLHFAKRTNAIVWSNQQIGHF